MSSPLEALDACEKIAGYRQVPRACVLEVLIVYVKAVLQF